MTDFINYGDVKMKNNSRAKKFIATLALLVAVTSTLLAGCTKSGGGTTVRKAQLSVVQNISYNEKYVLCWDAVDNANAYVVSINGENIQVDTNEYFYVPTKAITEFKVRATDTNGKYESSDWSEAYTYNVNEQVPGQGLYAKVNVFVSDLLGPSYKLKKIYSIDARNKNLYTAVLCEYNDRDCLLYNITEYDEEITSLDQAMELDGITYLGDTDALQEYYSATALFKYNLLSGELRRNYQQNGYDISIVSAQTAERENYRDIFTIYGTFKAEKDGDVKYFSARYKCTIYRENPERSYAREMSCVELTGDFRQYAEEKDNLNTAP